MVQLQCMDARLDTFSMELYQANICVGHIAQRQASMVVLLLRLLFHHLLPWLLSLMMMMMMMLPMMLMEMLALPMRCLLDTLPFVTRDKKGE